MFVSELGEQIKEMLSYGCTRVELGVQAPDDKIYRLVKRGHKVKDVIEATQRLKDSGFKVGYHIMPGLPGSNPNKDISLFRKIFKNLSLKIKKKDYLRSKNERKSWEQNFCQFMLIFLTCKITKRSSKKHWKNLEESMCW